MFTLVLTYMELFKGTASIFEKLRAPEAAVSDTTCHILGSQKRKTKGKLNSLTFLHFFSPKSHFFLPRIPILILLKSKDIE